MVAEPVVLHQTETTRPPTPPTPDPTTHSNSRTLKQKLNSLSISSPFREPNATINDNIAYDGYVKENVVFPKALGKRVGTLVEGCTSTASNANTPCQQQQQSTLPRFVAMLRILGIMFGTGYALVPLDFHRGGCLTGLISFGLVITLTAVTLGWLVDALHAYEEKNAKEGHKGDTDSNTAPKMEAVVANLLGPRFATLWRICTVLFTLMCMTYRFRMWTAHMESLLDIKMSVVARTITYAATVGSLTMMVQPGTAPVQSIIRKTPVLNVTMLVVAVCVMMYMATDEESQRLLGFVGSTPSWGPRESDIGTYLVPYWLLLLNHHCVTGMVQEVRNSGTTSRTTAKAYMYLASYIMFALFAGFGYLASQLFASTLHRYGSQNLAVALMHTGSYALTLCVLVPPFVHCTVDCFKATHSLRERMTKKLPLSVVFGIPLFLAIFAPVLVDIIFDLCGVTIWLLFPGLLHLLTTRRTVDRCAALVVLALYVIAVLAYVVLSVRIVLP